MGDPAPVFDCTNYFSSRANCVVEYFGRRRREMKELPNGIYIFNATPHPIRFWAEGWPGPVEVSVDEVVSARVEETPAPDRGCFLRPLGVEFVATTFVGTDEGRAVIKRAYADGADIVVGSIVAAQAYPGLVCAMTPAPGYERVPPAEKRMHPGKFTIFE